MHAQSYELQVYMWMTRPGAETADFRGSLVYEKCGPQGQRRVTGKRTDGPPLRTQRQETGRQQTKRRGGRHMDDGENGAWAACHTATLRT